MKKPLFQFLTIISMILITGGNPFYLWAFDAEGAAENLYKNLAEKKIEREVPDTLDLAERGRLAINNLTQAPWDITLSSDSLKSRLEHGLPESFINAKQLRTLPKLRLMCGSRQNIDAELAVLKKELFAIKEAQEKKDYASLANLRRIAPALMAWHEIDHNPEWLEGLHAIAQGVNKAIIRVEDRAYFPTAAEANPFIPYTPPDEPPIDQIGREGTVRWDQSWALRVLVWDYLYNGNKESLETALAVKRFLLKPAMWEDPKELNAPGKEHGIFAGHFHGGLTGLHALLEMAIATDDESLKQLVAEAYDHARLQGVVRLGWYPMWFPAGSYKRPVEQSSYCETCGIADLAILAIQLSEAGLGDHWDDVDSIVRNQLSEQQFISGEELLKYGDPHPLLKPLVARLVGGFGLSEPAVKSYCYVNYYPQVISGCCSPNGARALYFIWNGMTQFQSGVATVNLLLNRDAPWLSLDSYLPYEGKVVVHNKQAHTILVRIPQWIARKSITLTIGGEPREPAWGGHFLLIDRLKADDSIKIEFKAPVHENEEYTIYGRKYKLDFRGSNVISIQPADLHPGREPMYQHQDYLSGKAPMHRVTRFVADRFPAIP